MVVLAVASAAGVVLRRNPIHSALFLVVHLATLAAFFLKMRAEFLATAQIIVDAKIPMTSTLAVFVPFAMIYMGQPLKLDYLWAGLCLLGAVYFIFR